MNEYKPFLIAWNLTRRCNLRCEHCYLSAGERDAGSVNELSTAECFRAIDGMAAVNPGSILVLTGGEPLLRRDLPRIARHASDRGMMVVVGTNGTLLTDDRIRELQTAGVMGASISVDSLDPKKHDAFRRLPGALAGALRGIEACNRNGLSFQIHTTASRMNFEEIPALIDFAYEKKALVFNLFFLVCTGRGEEMSDITPEQYEQVLGRLLDIQERYPGMLIRARCAPHFKRIAFEKNPALPITRAQGYEGGGCLAGTHYARIGPDGELTPCPFMPLSVGDLREESFARLWDEAPVFKALRAPRLSGKCGECEYAELCGGCRARPFAAQGDYLGEDQWCLYQPVRGRPLIEPLRESDSGGTIRVIWTSEAQERLDRLPYFLRNMIKGRVERRALEAGLGVITLEFMENLRKKTFGDSPPNFRGGRIKGMSD